MYIKFTPYHFCTPDRGKSLPLHSPHSLRSPCNKTNRLWPTSGLIHLVLFAFVFHSYLSTPHFAQTCLFQFNPNLDLPLSSFHVCLHFLFSFILSTSMFLTLAIPATIVVTMTASGVALFFYKRTHFVSVHKIRETGSLYKGCVNYIYPFPQILLYKGVYKGGEIFSRF